MECPHLWRPHQSQLKQNKLCFEIFQHVFSWLMDLNLSKCKYLKYLTCPGSEIQISSKIDQDNLSSVTELQKILYHMQIFDMVFCGNKY